MTTTQSRTSAATADPWAPPTAEVLKVKADKSRPRATPAAWVQAIAHAVLAAVFLFWTVLAIIAGLTVLEGIADMLGMWTGQEGGAPGDIPSSEPSEPCDPMHQDAC